MSRFRLTQEQQDLIAVLPLAITKSEVYKKLTDAQRLVLAQIDLQDGTDFSADNGYIYATNGDLMKNTGIASEHTVIGAVRRLVDDGLIETRRGHRRKGNVKASEYVLTDKYYQLCERENPHAELQYMGCNKDNEGCNNTELQYMYCNKQNEGCNNYEASTMEVIQEMLQRISKLERELEEMKAAIKAAIKTPKNEGYCSTDTESDIYNTQSTQCISHVPASDDTMNVESLNEVEEKHACETDDAFDPSQHSDIEAMVQADAGVSVRCDEDKTKYAERNAWISKLFNKLQVNLDALSKCYDKRLVTGKDGYADTLSKLINSADSKIEAGWFTDKQVNKLNGYIKRYNGLMRDRCERFGVQDTASLTSEGDSGSGSKIERPAPTTAVPNFTEEEYQHALQEVFSSWDKWTYLSRVGFGLHDHKQQVAQNLKADVNLIDHAKFEADVRKMFIA